MAFQDRISGLSTLWPQCLGAALQTAVLDANFVMDTIALGATVPGGLHARYDYIFIENDYWQPRGMP